MLPSNGWVRRACARFTVVVLGVLLAACGGGGDDPDTPPTALPASLELSGPAEYNAQGAPVPFSSNASATGLSHQWDFGDGTTSTEAALGHSYAKPGVYTVRLTVRNEAGTSRTASMVVRVSDFQIVQGKHCSGASNTGWCWQQPVPQGNALLHHFFLNDTLGWAVGEAGTVLTTTDGGVTWQGLRSGTDLTLSKVLFTNAQEGWIVASNGQLLKTSDGGAHWTLVSSGLTNGIYLFNAADSNTAWIQGQSSEIVATTNGGQSWARFGNANTYLYMRAVVNATTAWGSAGGSTVSRTTDGSTWADIALPSAPSGMSRSGNDIHAVSATHAWVRVNESGWVANNYVSHTRLLRTRNGGTTWSVFDGTAISGFTLQFLDADNGYAWSYNGLSALKTIDGGASWQPLTLPPLEYAYYAEFHASSPRHLLVKDSSGKLYRSLDGGTTWVERSTGGAVAAPNTTGLWFFDSREGIATTANGGLLRTTDGGQTWASTAAQVQVGWKRPQFLSDGTGWVISDSGTIYRSSDKGRTWMAPAAQTSVTMSYLSDFHFVDGLHGWAVSSYMWSGNGFFRSTDGGVSWHAIPGMAAWQGFAAIRFADASHGIAVGPAGLALTTSDGGDTWTPRATNTTAALRRVTFIDAQTAVAVGEQGHIVRSTDRGHSWTRVSSATSATLHDVRFVSATTGWAVGDGGTVLVTHDGGLTWAAQPAVTNRSLSSLFFLDEQTGWIAGDNGTILATATGGR